MLGAFLDKELRAKLAAERARLRFINGFNLLIRDPQRSVGRTPFEIVYSKDKLSVRRYIDQKTRPRFRTPVLLVPPLMVKPFIFDLYPARSLVQHLLRAGFAVYLVDFGEPDRADATVTLDHYVVDWIPAACAAVKAHAEIDELSLLGYCMGGLFVLSHTAANKDRSVRNIVTIASPVDTQKMGLFAWMAKHGGRQAVYMTRRLGRMPGVISSAAFRLLTPIKNITRYADLLINMWDDEYVSGFEAMNQWMSQFIDYPQEAFVQFLRDFMRHNKLVRGKMSFRGQVADLGDVRASLLAVAGTKDQIAPRAAVAGAIEAIGSEDKEMIVAPGGHLGVFAGVKAPEHVWEPTARWLAARSTLR